MPIIIHRKPSPLVTAPSFGPLPPLKTFQCMLAASEIPNEFAWKAKLKKGPLMYSNKYDGIRSPMTGGVAMSRKMLKLPNLFIQEWAKEWGVLLNGLDGELIVGPPNLPDQTFNTSTSGINSIEGEPDFKFYVFDQWNSDALARTRYRDLKQAFVKFPSALLDRLVLVEQHIANDYEDLKAGADLAIDDGYEGVIAKDPSLMYKFGRSSVTSGHALKWKDFIDFTCVILEVKQGMKNMNEAKKDELGHTKRSSAKAGKVPVEEVGGFVVRCIEPESKYFDKVFSCGPGFLTDDELRNLWTQRDVLPGRQLRVKAQKLGAVNLPRYPGFFGFLS